MRVPDAGAVHGPRGSADVLLTPEEVWSQALSAHQPSALDLVSTIGGLALFGVTSTQVQAHLASGNPAPAPSQPVTVTPKQGVPCGGRGAFVFGGFPQDCRPLAVAA